jgi:hypothetical protein
MTSLLRCVACAALAIALGSGIGSAIGWHSAAAITVEDSAGNPDVIAPLTDPDDGNGATSSQGGGFTIIAPDQGGSGLTFGSPTMPTDTSDQSQ